MYNIISQLYGSKFVNILAFRLDLHNQGCHHTDTRLYYKTTATARNTILQGYIIFEGEGVSVTVKMSSFVTHFVTLK